MKQRESGGINVLLIPFILLIIFFIGATSFGIWAYLGRQDYKNNVTPKIEAAVSVAQKQTASEKEKEFLEKEKLPLRTYSGPSDYGSVVMQYPKTWSGYVASAASGGSIPLDGYFYPGIVPTVTDQGKAFAVRIQIVDVSYGTVLNGFKGAQQNNLVQAKAYSLPKVPGVVGVQLTGVINQPKSGTMILLPLRDKTLKIWTEGNDFSNDFNNIILPNFTFSP